LINPSPSLPKSTMAVTSTKHQTRAVPLQFHNPKPALNQLITNSPFFIPSRAQFSQPKSWPLPSPKATTKSPNPHTTNLSSHQLTTRNQFSYPSPRTNENTSALPLNPITQKLQSNHSITTNSPATTKIPAAITVRASPPLPSFHANVPNPINHRSCHAATTAVIP
jgi:hypothetical protein